MAAPIQPFPHVVILSAFPIILHPCTDVVRQNFQGLYVSLAPTIFMIPKPIYEHH